jgi:hypothetical protein
MHLNGTTWVISFSSLSYYHIHPDQVQDQPTTQVDLFLQNHNKKIFILLFYTYTVISKISNLMQKCVTIYSNIRTTHKYGNIIYRWKLKNI